jgi:alkylation response protein AidB-like acyl-CoA dehydrogenase
VRDLGGTLESIMHFFDIFEGTEQIQQLVIARAISGLRIE